MHETTHISVDEFRLWLGGQAALQHSGRTLALQALLHPAPRFCLAV
jgi:hypothetical protein